MKIPIIDIFAGPGGLGEGFSAFKNPENSENSFKIALSIEKEFYAHQTLTLRSFFRQFNDGDVPSEYYQLLRGEITMEELFQLWSKEANKAKKEAWLAELGEGQTATSNKIVDKRVQAALNGSKNWLLIGGPPCQAYSVVGRSRRQEKTLDEKKDKRVGLYKQYLRILAIHSPSVFVMENVKGLLSAKTKASPIFSNILNDLADPVNAYISEDGKNGIKLNCPGYNIYSLVAKPRRFDLYGKPDFAPSDFLIFSENYGVPQTRHRVILLGIRKDFDILPDILSEEDEVPISQILNGLPRLRSGLSRIEDNGVNWKNVIINIHNNNVLNGLDKRVVAEMEKQLKKVRIPHKGPGSEFIPGNTSKVKYRPDWYIDEKINGVCNHSSRAHMESDLIRYFFVSCFGKVKRKSPRLRDFPSALLPAHKNIEPGKSIKKFSDRFKVQLWHKPSNTITSHISKDGHYYIHPDATQCRSLTVREAARIQTFPDNYFFCGSRTSQFVQVGNAVPPLLANKIAGIVFKLFHEIQYEKTPAKKKDKLLI